MNKDSIIFSTSLNYIITIVLLIFSFLFLHTSDKVNRQEHAIDKYKTIVKFVHKQNGKINQEFKKLLNDMNYELLSIEESSRVFEKDRKPIFIRGKGRDSFRVYEIEGNNYLIFGRVHDGFIIKDNEYSKKDTNIYLSSVFILLFFVITFLYIKTLKKLSPLKKLKQNFAKLAEENYDIEFEESSKKDEISLLINEFKNTAKKLKDIKESRNVFIRNIMHELKTPITKGKIVQELPKSEKNDQILKMVFNKLESLINEFANIEELIATKKKINKKSYYLADLIDEAKDILMIEDDLVDCEFENIKLNVNFKLFSIALKNLIDNAVKYSKNSKVIIRTENEDILIINEAEALKDDFENYLEPFSKKSSNESFGLGLYIVYNILKANSYDVNYRHKDGKNIITLKRI
ncbi:ArsS family sensor histidine kinase [Arcobacter porcinus]|uniref:histidine kinase n=1 Tax=Arcobacter porcinus TaxID=1935204 RepID=A0A5C2HE78_9BACT|nr:ArsS family sensor histidine kinase [Arcobacter porcinus]OCL94387.1 Sensor kinase CusS [Aliarcobacter thereius]QEP41266.1 two-component system sensor histidine kinase [Arcobacter porcinus]